jgi:hypothetical protein
MKKKNGRLMLNVLGSVAQFEGEIVLERQRACIEKAKAEGKYKGRKPTARAKPTRSRRCWRMAWALLPSPVSSGSGGTRSIVLSRPTACSDHKSAMVENCRLELGERMPRLGLPRPSIRHLRSRHPNRCVIVAER